MKWMVSIRDHVSCYFFITRGRNGEKTLIRNPFAESKALYVIRKFIGTNPTPLSLTSVNACYFKGLNFMASVYPMQQRIIREKGNNLRSSSRIDND